MSRKLIAEHPAFKEHILSRFLEKDDQNDNTINEFYWLYLEKAWSKGEDAFKNTLSRLSTKESREEFLNKHLSSLTESVPVSPEQFAKTWQESNSIDEVSTKLKLPVAAAAARAAEYRITGVDLKKMSRGEPRKIDVEKLKKIVEGIKD